MTCLPVRFPIARISRGCTIRQFISGVLALPTLFSVVWFGAFGMGVGLPFFVFGYLQIYSLMRALREDAGEVGVLHTRRWHRVLPPEEFQRRSEEGSLTGAAVVAPDYVHGTEPENAPEIEHPEQPEFVLEHHESTGTLPAVRPQD